MCIRDRCIPSKALLHASELFEETNHNFSKLGIVTGKASVNWDKMLDYKSDIVNQNTKGIEFLFKKNKIDVIKGWGSIKEPGIIEVNGKTFNSKSIIIATGSEPSPLQGINVDENNQAEDIKDSSTPEQTNEDNPSSAFESDNLKSNEESIESISFIAEPSKEKRTRSNK